ncbi:hypothetical protein [Streptomyces sp. NPDC020983]|uniref:hypothetical protein n=1 Tax=Streptomyces sp. NPDC020983 TaxID=3365106 RepID=UPI0037B6A44B
MTPAKGGRCTAGHCGIPKSKPSVNDIADYKRMLDALKKYWAYKQQQSNVATGYAGGCTGNMPYGCGVDHSIAPGLADASGWQKLVVGIAALLPAGALCAAAFLECVSAGTAAVAGANAAMNGEGAPEIAPSEGASLLEAAYSSGGCRGSAADLPRLQAGLAADELAGADGHAFDKHVLEKGEFPGIRTRAQFSDMIYDVITNGERRVRSGGTTAYWRNGVIVIRNPKAADGGTVFAPKEGYRYFTRNFQSE